MHFDFPERDWKLFSRKLRQLALERYCQRVLDEITQVAQDQARTPHERYLAVWKLIHERDDRLADMFNGVRRSRALVQLAMIRREGLLTDAECADFSQQTNDWCAGRFS